MAEDTEVLPRQLTVGVSLEVRELVSREFPLPVAHLVVDVKYGSRLTGLALNSSPHRHDAVLRYPVIGKTDWSSQDNRRLVGQSSIPPWQLSSLFPPRVVCSRWHPLLAHRSTCFTGVSGEGA